MGTLFRQLKALIVLPGNVTLILPALILWILQDGYYAWHLQSPFNYLCVIVGVVLILVGIGLFYYTGRLFMQSGRGTIVRWNPPEKLIVKGPYRYVRNPMISGIIFVLLGESVLFTSIGILGLAVFFFVSNHFYFLYSEEPDLEKRFGDEYREYVDNVPRWLPRFSPWSKNNTD